MNGADSPPPSPSADATTANPERLRERLADLLGADRWIALAHPAVAPVSEEEVLRLLQGYPGEIMVIGSGSGFPADYQPPTDTLILLTARLTGCFSHSVEDQVVEVSAGFPVMDLRRRLAAVGHVVPALERFNSGTVGGRLAAVPSRQTGNLDGWIQSLLGILIATPDGDLLNLGGKCIKDVAGYDLRHLYTGSRGTIGVVLRAIFRCRPETSWKSPASDHNSIPTAGRFDPKWKTLLDPKGRMRSGA